MKPIVILALLLSLSSTIVFGQIKIGDNPQNIDASSVLELESTNKVLVISRVTNAAMESITPLRGGVVYNTDTQCLHYFNGTEWINLCDAVSFSLTNDPIENITSTISIVDNGGTINLEVAPNSIRSENIVDGGINGDDIQNNSIGVDQIGGDAVGANELRDNSVSSIEIVDRSIRPEDMANANPNQVLTTNATGIVNWVDASTVSGVVTDITTITGTGIAGDELAISEAVQNAISVNSQDIAEHIGTDMDTDDRNELTDLSYDAATNTLSLTRSEVGTTVDLGELNNAGTDEQNLTLAGTTLNISNGIGVDLNPILLAAADGDETIINQGANITISGDGTAATPYVINAADGAVADGSETEIIEGANITITGNGTNATPYVINADASAVADGSETEIVEGANITITGNGTNATPYIITAEDAVGDGSETQINQGANITVSGIGTIGDPYVINADVGAVADEQQLTLEQPGNLLTLENGGAPINLTPFLDNQNAAEVPVSANPTNYAAGAGNVEAHLAGIDAALVNTGTQNLASVLAVDNSAGNLQINDLADPTLPQDAATQNYVETRIATILASGGVDGVVSTITPSTTGFEVIGTNGGFNGAVDLDATFATDAELAALSVNDADFDPNNEIELPIGGAAGQILATDGAGTYTWVDDQSTAGTIISGDADNLITPGTDTGALLTEADLDATFATDAELAALSVNDADFDPNNEIELPIGGAAGQILATDGAGTYTWVDDQSTAGTIISGDADNLITPGTDTGALLTEADLDATFATDAELAALSVNDADFDPNNEIELPIGGAAGQILATDGAGTYTWVDDQSTAGTIISGDADNLITPGTDTGALLTEADLDATFATDAELAALSVNDADFDPNNEIELPIGGAAGQILATDGAGTYTWVDDQSTAGTIISGDADNLITPGTDTGALLTEADLDATFATDAELAALSVNDADFDPNNEIELPIGGAAGQILATDGAGTYTWVDDQSTAGTIISGDADNLITPGTDTGALLTEADLDATFATDAELAALSVNDADFDPNNEIQSITSPDGSITVSPAGVNDFAISIATISGGPSGLIAANSLTQGDIGPGAIGPSEIQSDAVSSDEIEDGTVLNDDIGFGIAGSKIIPNFVAQDIITTGNITGAIFNAAGIINAAGGINSTGAINLNGIALIPDYVFQKYFTGTSALNKNYTFQNLQEIESFVRQNQHLPGVQSAAAIKKQGYWNLGEASRINLEKIEELFLHTIEQEKKINELKQTNETMAKEVEQLKAQMEDIKKMVIATNKI